ncbi:DinB family protein [Alkalicoccus chagannorensis]|uniref:DinB family protein n=1 Tax=Alkalicoccus chagannorensis TaxID=427072 RepID=UPI00040FF90B|nr:DinB family protein [Alkalicoccus chagannorensis]
MTRVYIETYLHELRVQRQVFRRELEAAEIPVWERPYPGKWSVGETYEHLYLLLRFMRRWQNLYLPAARLTGLKTNRPYETENQDIYAHTMRKKGKAMPSPPMFKPKGLLKMPTARELERVLDSETHRIDWQLRGWTDAEAAAVRHPDPVAGWPNVLQGLHTVILHERHHFALSLVYAQRARKGLGLYDQ